MIIILIVSILLSVIPYVLLYKWLKKKEDNEKYREICKNSFKSEIIAIIPIIIACYNR